MPWQTTRPPGTKAKYRSVEHRRERAKWEQEMQRVGYLVCAQPVCVMPSRVIERGDKWCAGHDETGTVYIGPVHFKCNVRDGAKRGNARSSRPRRWLL